MTVYSPNSSSSSAVPLEVAPPPLISPRTHQVAAFLPKTSISSPQMIGSPTSRTVKRKNGAVMVAPTSTGPILTNGCNLSTTTVIAFNPSTISSNSLVGAHHYRHRPEDLSRYLRGVGPNVQVQVICCFFFCLECCLSLSNAKARRPVLCGLCSRSIETCNGRLHMCMY